jgi:hypothetical protein
MADTLDDRSLEFCPVDMVMSTDTLIPFCVYSYDYLVRRHSFLAIDHFSMKFSQRLLRRSISCSKLMYSTIAKERLALIGVYYMDSNTTFAQLHKSRITYLNQPLDCSTRPEPCRLSVCTGCMGAHDSRYAGSLVQ